MSVSIALGLGLGLVLGLWLGLGLGLTAQIIGDLYQFLRGSSNQSGDRRARWRVIFPYIRPYTEDVPDQVSYCCLFVIHAGV